MDRDITIKITTGGETGESPGSSAAAARPVPEALDQVGASTSVGGPIPMEAGMDAAGSGGPPAPKPLDQLMGSPGTAATLPTPDTHQAASLGLGPTAPPPPEPLDSLQEAGESKSSTKRKSSSGTRKKG